MVYHLHDFASGPYDPILPLIEIAIFFALTIFFTWGLGNPAVYRLYATANIRN
jgi:hypothetical protein